jgi:hypothetical protein
MDIFTTLGDMLRPDNLPQIPELRKNKPGVKPQQAEDYYTWACTLCGFPCAGPKNSIHVCKSCEDAAKPDYDLQRDIERDIEDDRRRRDEDWQREYTHFPNF